MLGVVKGATAPLNGTMGNDGHVPALPILCGFASVSHAVACARCERTNPNACRKTEFFDSLKAETIDFVSAFYRSAGTYCL